MFSDVDIATQLAKVRRQTRTEEDSIISETRRILNSDLLTEKKILQNLREYNISFELFDEEDAEIEKIFTLAEIRSMAITYRLKFLESRQYKPDIPYEAVLMIKDLNSAYRKELKEFWVLSTPESFGMRLSENGAALFVKTNYDNFYLLHRWGAKLPWSRRFRFWPLRSLETLILTVMVFTLAVTLSLPTWLITLDSKATYWCGFRLAAYFHLLIFFSGFTAFYTFAFTKNFSSSIWNRQSDFG